MAFHLELNPQQSKTFASIVSSLQDELLAHEFASIIKIPDKTLEFLMWSIYRENNYFEDVSEEKNSIFSLTLTF